MALEDCYNANQILESPSAEQNKGPMYNVMLGPIVFPRLTNDALRLQGSGEDDAKAAVRVLELTHLAHFVLLLIASSRDNGGNNNVGMEWHPRNIGPVKNNICICLAIFSRT